MNHQNEPGTDATELMLWIENTESLYRQHMAIIENLKRHMLRGRYNPAQAVTAWKHLTDAGSDSYRREFGHRFPVAVRRELAAWMEPIERAAILGGEYSDTPEETARLRRAYRLSRCSLRSWIRELAEEERAADLAAIARENHRQAGYDTGYRDAYVAEFDRLDRIYTDARNRATNTELLICEQSPATRENYTRFRNLVVRHYNAI